MYCPVGSSRVGSSLSSLVRVVPVPPGHGAVYGALTGGVQQPGLAENCPFGKLRAGSSASSGTPESGQALASSRQDDCLNTPIS